MRVPSPLRAESDAPFARRAVFEELESRLLMSADLNPVAQETLLAAPALQGAEFRALSDDGSAVTKSAVAAVQRTNELIFIDPRVPDREQLLAGLTAQSAEGRQFEVITLDASRDGIAQVTDALRGRIQVDAVHFITHGADGAVQLGGTWLDAKTLAANAEAVAGWGDSLKQDADVLFYGCDLASSASGRALMQWIAELTRGDVAASTDATGAAGQGGDWDLEAKVGAIETQVAVAADARASWSHVLSGVPSGGEDPVNIETNNAQDSPAVATAPDGRYVVAWSGRGPGDSDGIFVRLYDANGTPQSVEIPVNTTTGSAQFAPAVAMDAAGNFVVAWSGQGTGDNDGVFIRRFSAAGNPLGVEQLVNVAVGNNQSAPDIAMESNGDFAVVWQSDEIPGNLEIWMRRYLANGTPIGLTLVSTSGNADTNPTIAMDDDGDLVVTWEGQDGGSLGVFARRYDSAGVAKDASPFLVNATTSGNQRRPDVAMDANGNFFVVWDGQGGSDGQGVYGRRYGNAPVLTPLGGEFLVNTVTTPVQSGAAVSMAGNGRSVVTWESNNQAPDGSGAGVFAQEYLASGAADGGEALVNTTTTSDQRDSAVAMDDGGGYTVAWAGNGPGDSDGVFERRFLAAATGTIAGTVYHDVDGDGNLAGASTFAGATVYLFRDIGVGTIDILDLWQDTTVTSAAGTYTFTGLGNGTYYVVVDSKTLGAANVWAEQTYGSAGSALGSGFTSTAGALLGGRERLGAGTSTSDAATALNPTTAEHVTKVTLTGAGAGGVDFGFSLNAITTARDGDDEILDANRSVQGSLRQFIQNSNVTPLVQAANFSIGGGGPQSIVIAGGLPALTVTDQVVLDGSTQGGFSGTPLIELNGASAGGVIGLTLGVGSDASVIRGLAVTRFTYGISIDSRDNTIGGTTTDARNVISLNSLDGVRINPNGTGNQIIGNYIGIAADGTTAAGNSGSGVSVSSTGNTIGGTAPGAGNVISANGTGVLLSAGGNFVQGNRIGTDVNGTLDRGNLTDGVRISNAAGNTIGGTVAAARNLISGNNSDGIEITGTGSTSNVVAGNFIGTDAAGGGDVGNTQDGIRISSGATGTTIGGTAPGARNVISGSGTSGVNSDGIDIGVGSGGNVIQGNRIGINANGAARWPTSAAGSGSRSGSTSIGGSTPARRNVISGNPIDGISSSARSTTSSRATTSARTRRLVAVANGRGRDLAQRSLEQHRRRRPPSSATSSPATLVRHRPVERRFGQRDPGEPHRNQHRSARRARQPQRRRRIYDGVGAPVGGTAPGAGNVIASQLSCAAWRSSRAPATRCSATRSTRTEESGSISA